MMLRGILKEASTLVELGQIREMQGFPTSSKAFHSPLCGTHLGQHIFIFHLITHRQKYFDYHLAS